MITPASHREQSSGNEELLDIPGIMAGLAIRRPIFHSEADFQHEFAMLLREQMPNCKVRLEKPLGNGFVGATDIVVTQSGSVCGIELKYLTKKLVFESDGELFHLKAQGATDLRRYDVLKDVARLEAFNTIHCGTSYVVALTNDSAYWNETKRHSTIDANFRLCHGRSVSGELHWADYASAGSIRGREQGISLKNEYKISWQDFCVLPDSAAMFKYLCLEVR